MFFREFWAPLQLRQTASKQLSQLSSLAAAGAWDFWKKKHAVRDAQKKTKMKTQLSILLRFVWCLLINPFWTKCSVSQCIQCNSPGFVASTFDSKSPFLYGLEFWAILFLYKAQHFFGRKAALLGVWKSLRSSCCSRFSSSPGLTLFAA